MKARRRKKKEPLTEKEIVKFAEELGYDLEPIESNKTKRSPKPEVRSDSVVEMWRDKDESDVAPAHSKQASAKRRLASQLNTYGRCNVWVL